MKIYMTWASNMHALERRDTMDQLALSLTTGTLAATRPRISFHLLPRKSWTPDERTSQLDRVRDILLVKLASLRGEGRLRIMSSVVDQHTGEEIIINVRTACA